MQKDKKKIFRRPVGRKPTLTIKEEEDIVTVVSTASDLGWPCDRKDVAEIIGNYCRCINRKTYFKNDIPGSDCMIKNSNVTKKTLKKKCSFIEGR